MPKATLTFNLPEEQEEYTTTMKAGNFSSALWEYDQQFLRANIKHGVQSDTVRAIIADINNEYREVKLELSDEVWQTVIEATLDHARSKLYEIMNSCDGNPFA